MNDQTNLTPKEITIDIENNIHIAHFDYYTGISYSDHAQLSMTTTYKDFIEDNPVFMVACGDVMIRVKEDDYPNIERKTI